jgi:succinoglycan biosynthesis protein ExoA
LGRHTPDRLLACGASSVAYTKHQQINHVLPSAIARGFVTGDGLLQRTHAVFLNAAHSLKNGMLATYGRHIDGEARPHNTSFPAPLGLVHCRSHSSPTSQHVALTAQRTLICLGRTMKPRPELQESENASESATTAPGKPFVSIVMPALNEERYIAEAVHSILPTSGDLPYELLIVDGGSTDRTREIVQGLAASNPRIRLLFNIKKYQAAAVNLAAREADPRSSFLVRADCHTRFPAGFVERCVGELTSRRVASVVVPMHTEGSTCLQRAIAHAQNSRMGNGGSAHRIPGRSGYVDHGHHAAFDRRIFLALGGYDERFTHNEDAEFDRRLIQAGKRIYLDSDAAVVYYPRANFQSLARQYFRHGAGRASTILKHRAVPRARQVLPVAALLACALSLALAFFNPWFLVVPVSYAICCLLWGAGMALLRRDVCLSLSGIAAIVMHMSWGSGFLSRLVSAGRS